jgi:hypothetical protein
MKTQTQTQTVKVRDLKVGDIIRLNDEDHTVEKLAPYGTSYHSLVVVTDQTSANAPWSMDKLMEVELVGFMSPHFTIPVKPKVKRKSKIVQRIEDAGYHIEKQGKEWHVWRKDDHSVVAIYDRLRDIRPFPPYV